MFTLAPIINTKPAFLYSGEIFSGFTEYETNLRIELAKGSIQNAQTADFFQGNAHVISQYIEGLKADLMREPLEDRRNRARVLELQIYQLQVNGRAHGEHYDLGYLTNWMRDYPNDSAFRKEAYKIFKRKQAECGEIFARAYSHPELYYWLLANPTRSPFRNSVEKVYKEKIQDLRYCGEQHAIYNSFEALEEWLRIHTSQSPFRDAVVSGLQGRYGAYTAEYVLVTLGAIQNWLYGNPHQSPFRYGIEQVFSRKQSEDGRRFGEVNILNHIWGWLQQNPDESPFRDSMKEVYREKIIVDLLGDDLTHSYDWWNNPDAQLEYFFELAEQLGNENLLKKAQQEREYFLSQVPMLRHTQQRFWEVAYPQDYRSPIKNIDDWRNQVKQDPYVGESYRKYCQELANYNAEVENANRHRKRKKHRAIFRNIVGIGVGAFVSSLLPGLGSMVLTSVMRGAVFGAMSSAISRQSIAKGTFQGAFFAGLGGILGRGPIGITAIAAISTDMNGGNVLKNIGIALGSNEVVGMVGMTGLELTAFQQAFIKSTLATVLKGGDLGMALMAGSMGMLESVVQNTGETLGNGVRYTIQENIVVQPKRLAITNHEQSNGSRTINEQKPLSKELNDAVNETSRILEHNGINVSREKIVQIFEEHPNLKISDNIEDSLVRLGWVGSHSMGIPTDRQDALIRGVQQFVYHNRNEFRAVSLKVNTQNTINQDLVQRIKVVNGSFGINNSMDSEEAGRNFAADKSMKDLEKWYDDHPENSKFKDGVAEVYVKNKYLYCLVSGGVDNLTDGISGLATDLICQEKNSVAYKTGEAFSQLGWLFMASKDIRKLPGRVLKEFIANEIAQDEEDIRAKNK